MNAITLDDKLFHGVKPNLSCFDNYNDYEKLCFDNTVAKFDSIFLTGFIMCRKSIINKSLSIKSFSSKNYNGEDNVSLSRHISQEDKDNKLLGYIINDENAFIDYPFNYPAIVYDQNLFFTNKLVKSAVRILLELQVTGDINIEQAIALSMPGFKSILPFFETNTSLEEAFNNYKKDRYKYYLLKHLLKLMTEQAIQLPIICIDNGIAYKENNDYVQLIEDYEKLENKTRNK